MPDHSCLYKFTPFLDESVLSSSASQSLERNSLLWASESNYHQNVARKTVFFFILYFSGGKTVLPNSRLCILKSKNASTFAFFEPWVMTRVFLNWMLNVSLLAHAQPRLLSGERPSPTPARHVIETHLSSQYCNTMVDGSNSGEHPLMCFRQLKFPRRIFQCPWDPIQMPQDICAAYFKKKTPQNTNSETSNSPNFPATQSLPSHKKLLLWSFQRRSRAEVRKSKTPHLAKTALITKLPSTYEESLPRPLRIDVWLLSDLMMGSWFMQVLVSCAFFTPHM